MDMDSSAPSSIACEERGILGEVGLSRGEFWISAASAAVGVAIVLGSGVDDFGEADVFKRSRSDLAWTSILEDVDDSRGTDCDTRMQLGEDGA